MDRLERIDPAGYPDGLSFRHFDAYTDGDVFGVWRRDAWICAHGTDEGYEDIYLPYTAIRARRDADAVWVACMNGIPCGMFELDLHRWEAQGAGWISFFYIDPGHRGTGCGKAMMDAVRQVLSTRGRKSIALCVAQDNEKALGFYEHLGFVKIGEEPGVLCPLYDMEKMI